MSHKDIVASSFRFTNTMAVVVSVSMWMPRLFLLLFLPFLDAIRQTLLSRSDFCSAGSAALFLPSSTWFTADVLTCSAVFLPRGGGLALPIYVGAATDPYYAIIDTGSPFLTAPSLSNTLPTMHPATTEQFGQATGTMQWRQARSIRLGDRVFQAQNIILGVPDQVVIAGSGGIFLGLMQQDDYRPTLLQQLGYTGLCLDYIHRTLTLSRGSVLDKTDPMILPLHNLTPFGPNLHHVAVLCSLVVLETSTGRRVTLHDTSRPVVVVLDSGLTGCIFSDSWKQDLPVEFGEITAATLHLPTAATTSASASSKVVLSSNDDYWYPTMFRLPWFTSDDHHPHIIAAGATFLSQSKLTVDWQQRIVKMEV